MIKKVLASMLSLALVTGLLISPAVTAYAAQSDVPDAAVEIAEEDKEKSSQIQYEDEERPSDDSGEYVFLTEKGQEIYTEGAEDFSGEEGTDAFSDDSSLNSNGDLDVEAFDAEAFDTDTFSDDSASDNGIFDNKSSEGGLSDNETREFTLGAASGEDITAKLNTLLLKAGKQATDDKPCKVIIPPGNYQMTGTICLYSNIHLYASGATITKTSTNKHILLRLGNTQESAGGYEGYRNITIEGGVWDSNYESVLNKEGAGGFVGFRIGHATNVTVKDVTFLNNLKSHFLELAGVKDALVTGCTFRGYWTPYEEGGQECIQLDACKDYIFPGYLPYDGSVCENVTITNNVFEDVFAGVGSHSMMFDKPYRNVTVTSNRFTNLKKRAVWFLNYMDSRVENNVMTNVGAGVDVQSMHDKNVHINEGQQVSSEGNHQTGNILVSGNTISLAKGRVISGSYWRASGVQILGKKMSGSSTGVPDGVYTMQNVQVKNNTITGPGNGVRLELADNCQVSGNSIRLSRPEKFTNLGIYLGAARENTISSNKVERSANTGIYLYNGKNSYNRTSRRNSITLNTLISCGAEGIKTAYHSDYTKIYQNTVLYSRSMGIEISRCCRNEVLSNKVYRSGLDGIRVDSATVNTTVDKNRCWQNERCGIALYSKRIISVSGNNILENGKHGMYCSGAGIQTAKGNKMVKNASSYEIYARNTKGISTMRDMRISAPTSKTTRISGTAVGGRSISVYAERSGKTTLAGRGAVNSKGEFRISVKRQRKGTKLKFYVKDKNGNTVGSSYVLKR